jgi:hypothetical protein
MNYQSKKFLELLRSVRISEKIVIDKHDENCYYCNFHYVYHKRSCFDKFNAENIEVIKGRPEKNIDKCEKDFNYYSIRLSYYEYDDYYEDYDLMSEIENNIIKELGDPIENIKYLEFLLDEIDEDCELYCIINSIKKDNYPPPLLKRNINKTNYIPEYYNVKKSTIHYKNGDAYLYYMRNVIHIIFEVFNTNSDKIWLLDELVKAKTKYHMNEYKKLFHQVLS